MTSASTTPREKTTTIRGLVGRIMVLSLTLVAAIYLVPLLVAYRMWLWLGIVVLTTGAMFLLYSTKRFVPAKYWGAWCFSDWGSFSSRESIG